MILAHGDTSTSPLTPHLHPDVVAVVALLALALLAGTHPSGPAPAAQLAAYAGLALSFIGGLGGIGALSSSQLASSYSPALAKPAVTAAIGVGDGVVVAVVCSLFGPLPSTTTASVIDPPRSSDGTRHGEHADADREGSTPP